MTEQIRLEEGTWIAGERFYKGDGRFLCESVGPDGKEAVLKFIAKPDHLDPHLPDREVVIGPDLANVQGVLPVWDWGQHDEWWVIAMPRAEMSLADFLEQRGGRLQVNDARAVLLEIAMALNGVSEKIVHRDLKPQNILRWEGAWYIADFGSARYAEAATDPAGSRKNMYTPPYAAPEQIIGDHAGRAADIWALGCIMYHVVSGDLPFQGTVEDIRQSHLDGPPHRPDAISDQMWGLIVRCLHFEPNARPSLPRVIQSLSENVMATSDVDLKLASLGVKIAVRKAEEATLKEQERQWQERRLKHGEASKIELEMIHQRFEDRISNLVDPDIVQRQSDNSIQFNADPAQMSIGSWRPHATTDLLRYDLPLDILASSYIAIWVNEPKPDSFGAKRVAASRSHALWYCDPYKKGDYGWFETAFLYPHQSDSRLTINQPSLHQIDDQLQDILRLRQTRASQIILAMRFIQLDAAGSDQFIERWLDWFVKAAERQLPLQHYSDRDAYEGVRWKLL